MSGIDWDEEFTRMNPETPQKPSTPPTSPPGAPSKFSAKFAGAGRNTAALVVCGTIAVLAVCGTVVAVTSMQADQAAQESARAKEKAANVLVEAEADKQRAQTEETAAKTLYEREMAVYLECMKIRAAAVAKAASYEVSRIPGCAAPTLGGAASKAAKEPDGGVGGAINLQPLAVGGARRRRRPFRLQEAFRALRFVRFGRPREQQGIHLREGCMK